MRATDAGEVDVREETALKVIFGVGFVVAAGGSIALSFVGPVWLPAAWGSLCMGLYALTAWRRAPALVQGDDFADSLYYLGFLLTLVALVAVLIQLGWRDAQVASLSAVLPPFGLALSTTIIGLAGRTALTLFRTSPDDVKRQAEARLVDAFDDFTRALNRLTQEADGFGRRVHEQLDTSLSRARRTVDSFGAIVAQTADRTEPLLGRVDELAVGLARTRARLDEATNGITGDLGRLRTGIADHGEALQRELMGAGGTIRSGHAAIRESAEDLAAGLARSAAAVEAHVADVNAATSDVEQPFQELATAMRAVAAAGNETIGGLTDHLARLDAAITEADASIRTFGARLGPDADSLGEFMEEWRTNLDRIARHRRRLEAEVEQSGDAIVQFRRELAGGARLLREALADAGETAPHQG